MPYPSTITFTLDTICPWTYLAFLRLQKALAAYPASSDVTFTLRIAPYQLYPDFPSPAVDKYAWYRDEKFNGDEKKVKMYVEYMTALGRDEGVEMKLDEGVVGGTFEAHRVLHVVQEEFGAEKALKALESLYDSYFCQAMEPAERETLIKACEAAGLGREQAEGIVRDGERGSRETKMAIREQAGNGVDSVPYVMFEGRKRDFTAVGAKSVGEYGKLLEQVEKEAV